MNRQAHMLLSILLGGLALSACVPLLPPSTNAPEAITSLNPAPQSTMGLAQVLSVETQTQSGNAPSTNVVVRGILSESCASLGGWDVNYADNAFVVDVYVVSPNDRGCLQTVTPFETMIPLNTRDLPAGTYTVTVNGVMAVFTLPAVNPTPSSNPTPVPTPGSSPVTTSCSDKATFVSDVTIPDFTTLAPGVAFTKTWKLKNSGTCTWDSTYLVSYISGTTMSQQPGYWIVQPGQTVAPGQTANISVGMTAPVQDGSYASYWGLRQEHGRLMPVSGGANGNSFYVKIKVGNGNSEPPGNITAASIDIDLEQGSGAACTADSTYFVNATVSADGPATAAYEIGSSAGQISAGYFQTADGAGPIPYVTGALVFNQADTKTISLRFLGPYPYPADLTVMIRVNGGPWHSAKLAC